MIYIVRYLVITFCVCVGIKTDGTLLTLRERELNDNFYLGEENGCLIVDNNNEPYKFKLYCDLASVKLFLI